MKYNNNNVMDYSKFFDKILNLVRFIFHVLMAYLEAFYRMFVPPPMRSLTGEIVLVTGSAKGIGKEICKQLAASKVTLIMWDCDKLQNEKTARELKGLGSRIYTFHIDISDRNQVESVAATIKEEIGDVTIVVNNAAIAPIAEFLKTPPEDLEKTFQTNVLSHFWIIREFLPRMIENHHGHIATVCSIGGIRSLAGSVPYYGTKFAIHGYVEALKLQMSLLNCHGIRFTTIYPWFVDTGLVKDVKYSSSAKKWLNPILPFLKAEDVATKLIEGIRRNYEYVYCPSILHTILQLDNLLPLKIRREVALKLEQNLEHPNFTRITQQNKISTN